MNQVVLKVPPSHFSRRSLGEQQEAAEGAVVVAVVPDLSVGPQHHLQFVALLQHQGGAVGRRVAALAPRLLVGDQLNVVVVLVKHGAHGEVGGGVGGEADVVNSTNRGRELTCRKDRLMNTRQNN